MTKGVELTCDDCEQPYTVWFAPSPIWNFVMGGPEAKDDPGGMLCPRCFTLRAEAVGIVPTAWVVSPELPFAGSVMSEAAKRVASWPEWKRREAEQMSKPKAIS